MSIITYLTPLPIRLFVLIPMLLGFGAAEAFAQTKPNIILILADDLGYGDLGCYGNKTTKTPHLDALAKGGMKCTDFHSNGVLCTPTRAALLTGRYQQRVGLDEVLLLKKAEHQELGLPLSEVTIAEMLKNNGYATAIFGKWHLGFGEHFNPIHQGFDEFRGYVTGNVDYFSHLDAQGGEDWWHGNKLQEEAGYVTDLVTAHAVKFMEKHTQEPFFLFLPHQAAHYPYQGPQDTILRVPNKPNQTYLKGTEAVYRTMVESLDAGVGAVVATVKKLGIEKNTLIIFCSDNGPTGPGSSGTWKGRKKQVWEGGHRVPGIFYWPGQIKPGSVTATPILSMDIYPTIAAVCGAKLPENRTIDGVNLSTVLFKNTTLPERALFWKSGNQKAVRKGKWKLVVLPQESKEVLPVSLYDLSTDPLEKQDVSQAHPEKVAALEAELRKWEEIVTK